MQTVTAHGLAMPKLGLGTFGMTGSDCQRAVETALALGFRHIDTAPMYGNEDAIGVAVSVSGLQRSELHLTSKVHHELQSPARIRESCERSLGWLRTDCLDLLLIHWPRPGIDLPAVLETLMALQQEGRTRRIGVANFPVLLLKQALEIIRAPIVCNQIEYHVLIDQSPVLAYMRSHRLAVIAHVPLARGRLASEPRLHAIARKHGATSAQVALKWLLDQPDVAAVPKAANPENQLANLQALRLQLDDADYAAIAALPKRVRIVDPPFAPIWD
jgi:2,5-diketo-D-gluconate reductase B